EVVVDQLDLRVALLEGGELGRPVRPGRAGVEADHHAFLAGLLVERLLARIELRRVVDGLRLRGGPGSAGHGEQKGRCAGCQRAAGAGVLALDGSHGVLRWFPRWADACRWPRVSDRFTGLGLPAGTGSRRAARPRG